MSQNTGCPGSSVAQSWYKITTPASPQSPVQEGQDMRRTGGSRASLCRRAPQQRLLPVDARSTAATTGWASARYEGSPCHGQRGELGVPPVAPRTPPRQQPRRVLPQPPREIVQREIVPPMYGNNQGSVRRRLNFNPTLRQRVDDGELEFVRRRAVQAQPNGNDAPLDEWDAPLQQEDGVLLDAQDFDQEFGEEELFGPQFMGFDNDANYHQGGPAMPANQGWQLHVQPQHEHINNMQFFHGHPQVPANIFPPVPEQFVFADEPEDPNAGVDWMNEDNNAAIDDSGCDLY